MTRQEIRLECLRLAVKTLPETSSTQAMNGAIDLAAHFAEFVLNERRPVPDRDVFIREGIVQRDLVAGEPVTKEDVKFTDPLVSPIEPTLGRIVWARLAGKDFPAVITDPDPVVLASDFIGTRVVEAFVFGSAYQSPVQLSYHPGGTQLHSWRWMPYQLEQAAKS